MIIIISRAFLETDINIINIVNIVRVANNIIVVIVIIFLGSNIIIRSSILCLPVRCLPYPALFLCCLTGLLVIYFIVKSRAALIRGG